MSVISRAQRGLHPLLADPMGVSGLVLVLILIATALLAPWIAPYEPAAIDVPSKLLGPSAAHWLGTDQLGRDVLSRALWGGRVALAVSLAAITLSVLIGAI